MLQQKSGEESNTIQTSYMPQTVTIYYRRTTNLLPIQINTEDLTLITPVLKYLPLQISQQHPEPATQLKSRVGKWRCAYHTVKTRHTPQAIIARTYRVPVMKTDAKSAKIDKRYKACKLEDYTLRLYIERFDPNLKETPKYAQCVRLENETRLDSWLTPQQEAEQENV